MEKAWNRHHAFFNRSWYKTPLEKALRGHTGLVLPLHLQVHNELHANVLPPPKPNSRIILGSLAMLETLPLKHLNDPLIAIRALTAHLGTQEEKLAVNIANNLTQQLPYLEEGYWHK